MHDEMHITEAQAVYLEKFLNFRGNIAELAAAMDIPLVDMIDILSAPAVQKRIKAAAKLTKLRRKMIVADIEITALETLEQVAANKFADVVERRRAAAAILRALHKPKRRRKRATNLIHSRGQCPQTDPFDDPDGPGTHSPSQNRARQEASSPSPSNLPSPSAPTPPDHTATNAAIYCPQEFLDELRETRKNSPASNMTSSQVCTSDLVDAESLHPQEQTTKLLEETTQALIELDELCTQDDQDDFDPTPNLTKQSPERKRAGLPSANGESKPHFTNPTIQNEPIPTPDQTLDDYDPKTGLTISLNNHTSKHQQNNRKKPYPEKDNPWESHPFARAGRNLSADDDPP